MALHFWWTNVHFPSSGWMKVLNIVLLLCFVCSVVSIYDSRCLKKNHSQAVSTLQGHSLSISSAYFSPRTGNRVLTTCLDNHIRWSRLSTWNNYVKLFFSISAQCPSWSLLTEYMTHLQWLQSLPCWHPSGTSTMTQCFHCSEICVMVTHSQPVLSIFIFRHNMRTGRWLSKLSAVWDPKQEDCFVVGSLSNPRRVEVFHESGKPLHCFKDDENLKTVQSVTAFHPTRNALLGGNSSGRLHVFTDWDENQNMRP